MTAADGLTDSFEANRPHLRSVAYRMLGSLSEADDAVQEAWLRLSRSDVDEVANLRGWLTTVVSRICLDMLRSRASRREDSLDFHVPDPVVTPLTAEDPAAHAVLADSIGLALLAVLDTLSPAERLAFVLHDIFAVPFETIGSILDRSPIAAKQLASRARARLRGARVPDTADLARQWQVADAFTAAARDGDFEGLLAVLDPDIVLRADAGTSPLGPSGVIRGAQEVIARAQRFAPLARFAQPVLVNGGPGFIIVRHGQPLVVASVTVAGGKIVELDFLTDPDRLDRLDLAGVL